MPVPARHAAALVLAALLGAAGCSVTSTPESGTGIPAHLPAPDPHGAYTPEDAARAAAFAEWAGGTAHAEWAGAVARVKAVQVVEAGDEQHVHLHTTLPRAEGGVPPAGTAEVLAAYGEWPQRPAGAVLVGVFDGDGGRVGSAGVAPR
ncbi:hypothetical protein ACIRBY_35500 [Streptomyces sp. NPDC096136]|uniref:hypothetical protein n=1 Tax=Streptomyces sp. NPDC096136 TaxID=3366076 RepID=UPI0038267B56